MAIYLPHVNFLSYIYVLWRHQTCELEHSWRGFLKIKKIKKIKKEGKKKETWIIYINNIIRNMHFDRHTYKSNNPWTQSLSYMKCWYIKIGANIWWHDQHVLARANAYVQCMHLAKFKVFIIPLHSVSNSGCVSFIYSRGHLFCSSNFIVILVGKPCLCFKFFIRAVVTLSHIYVCISYCYLF